MDKHSGTGVEAIEELREFPLEKTPYKRFGLFLLLVLLLLALPVVLQIAGTNLQPYEIGLENRFEPPSSLHPFGTDALGRDLFARTLLGSGLSLEVAVSALLVALILALTLGTIAGSTRGRWPDAIISWFIGLLHTIPFVLLAVALAAVLQPGLNAVALIVGAIAWAAPARIVRAEVMALRSSRFVLAQQAFGMPPVAIFIRSIMPLCLVPPLASLLYLLPELIGIDVGLSFFGLGAQPPTPTIGRLIFDGLSVYQSGWWLVVMPASVLLAFSVALYSVLTLSKTAGAYRQYQL